MVRLRARFKRRTLLSAAAYSFFVSVHAHAVTTSWNTNASGSFTTPANWTNGMPDSDDTAVFNRGAGVAYNVTFPGGSIFNPPPNYAIDYLRVHSNDVTFRDNSSPFITSPSLTVAQPSPNFAIIVGENAGEVAVLSTSLISLSGARTLIGSGASAEGTLNILAGTFSMSNSIDVGDSGTGTLNVTGGSVSSTFFSAGFFAGAIGTVTVSGVGSYLTNNGSDFRVGLFGTGTFNITAGGAVSTGRAAIGQRSGSNGTVTVAGANAVWNILERLGVGGNAASGVAGGNGTLNIDPGGTVLVAQDIVLFPDGLLKLQGGNLAALAVGFQAGGDFDWTAGTFQVDTFNGDLVNQGGTLLPGSANETSIAGNYTQQSAGVMEFAIGGTTPVTDFNQVTVDDVASLDGTLDVTLRGNFTPSAGDMFELITATGGRAGTFAAKSLPTLAGNLDWNVIYGANSVSLQVVTGLFGDYNDDGSVDAADYVVWRKTDGAPAGYDAWRSHFGWMAGSGASAGLRGSTDADVPEPSSNCLVCCFAVSVLLVARS